MESKKFNAKLLVHKVHLLVHTLGCNLLLAFFLVNARLPHTNMDGVAPVGEATILGGHHTYVECTGQFGLA
jgi:hypothetical protein